MLRFGSQVARFAGSDESPHSRRFNLVMLENEAGFQSMGGDALNNKCRISSFSSGARTCFLTTPSSRPIFGCGESGGRVFTSLLPSSCMVLSLALGSNGTSTYCTKMKPKCASRVAINGYVIGMARALQAEKRKKPTKTKNSGSR